jgi:hypothetical protein
MTPEMDLDSSWQIALHLALKKGLIFGKDILFTYGPLFWIYQRFSIAIPLWGYVLLDVFFYFNLALMLYLAFKQNAPTIPALILLLVNCCIFVTFSTLDEYFLIAFFSFHLISFTQNGKTWQHIYAGVLAILISYVKFNNGIIALALYTIVTVALPFFRIRSWSYSLFNILIAAFIWIGIGKLFDLDLSLYLKGSYEIISGYMEAMYLIRDLSNLSDYVVQLTYLYFAIMILFIFILIRFRKQILNDFTLFTTILVLGAYFYVMYKHAIIRDNAGSIVLYFNMLVISVLPFLKPPIRVYVIFVNIILLFAAFSIREVTSVIGQRGFYILFPVDQAKLYYSNLMAPYASIDSSSADLLVFPERMRQKIGNKSVDIMPFEIASIYKSGMNYQPRPSIQSYNAYTKYIEEKNYSHFLSDKAPDFVIMKASNLSSVRNNKHLNYEENLSRLALLRRYKMIDFDATNELILLQKTDTILPSDTVSVTVERHAVGELIKVSKVDGFEFFEADVPYTPLGSFIKFLYKPIPLHSSVDFVDSTTADFVISRTLLNSSVLYNFAPKIWCDWVEFYSSKFSKQPKLLNVRFYSNYAWVYKDSFSLKRTIVKIRGHKESKEKSRLSLCNDIKPISIANSNESQDIRFFFDDMSASSNCVSAKGWALIEGVNSTNTKLFLAIKTADSTYLYPTSMVPRPDVSSAFAPHGSRLYDQSGLSLLLCRELIPQKRLLLGVGVKEEGKPIRVSFKREGNHKFIIEN